jgi:hypothetical protein
MILILNITAIKINRSITVEDAGGLAVFDDQIAVVLLVVGKVVVAVEKHFAQLGSAQGVVVNNAALGVYDPARQVIAGVVLDMEGAVEVEGHAGGIVVFKDMIV